MTWMKPSSAVEEEKVIYQKQSLGKRTLKGAIWLLIGRIYRQVLFLGRALVLGRLLAPHDFGLVGLGDLAIMFLGVLTYTGFGEALVQRPIITPAVIHTAWWVMLGRSLALASALWFMAPFIAALAHAPAATPILQALALVQVLSGFTSMGTILLNKDMEFRKLLKLDVCGVTIDLLVAITAAILWRNAWALVLGAFAGTLTRVIVSYIVHPYRPRLVFDLQEAGKLFRFGKWLLFSGFLYFLISKGTDVMSGFIFGATSLGLYQMASRFGLLPTNHLGEIFSQVLFPAYSLIKDDPQKLTAAFLKVIQVVTVVIFPLSAIMVVAIGPALPMLLGAKWQGVVSLVPGLALGGAVQTLLRTGGPLFMATGRPRCFFGLDLASSLGIVLCIYPLSRLLGLEGLAWSYAVGVSFGIPIWWGFVRRQSRAKPSELLVSLAPALLAGLLLAATIWFPCQIFHLDLSKWSSLGWLTMLVMIGSLVYGTFILLAERCLSDYQPIRASIKLIQTGLRKERRDDESFP